MSTKLSALFVLGLSVCCTAAAYADSAPFGVASAYNLVALTGNVGTQADVGGRIAAAGYITQSTTVGSHLGTDPYGSLANGYEMVAGKGISATNYFNVNGGGNVYAPTNTANYNWNESPHGSVVSSGPSPIDFASLNTAMQADTLKFSTMAPNGIVGAPTPKGGNPSWFVLSGTSTLVNVFNITAAEFADTNHPIDINVPAGSTVIINVSGASVTLGAGFYFNGNQVNDSNAWNILFNFPDATSVTINGQFDGALLAPYALLTGGSQMGGTFIAASIGMTGEVHYDAFTGNVPPSPQITPVPEGGPLTLIGAAALGAFLLLQRKKQAIA